MTRKISVTLGFIILVFGLLKFIDPFRTWYSVQIQTSEFPVASYYLGIAGEIIVGLVLILSNRVKNDTWKIRLLSSSSFALIVMMGVAIYVHLLPAVPAEVLPLKIKAPIIPSLFLTAAALNLYLLWAPRVLR